MRRVTLPVKIKTVTDKRLRRNACICKATERPTIAIA